MAQPIAYIRRSRVFDERASVSWEVQEAKVRELAALYGDNGTGLLILSDWNISGRKGAKDRPGYARLVEMVESGEASAIYSYNMARLSRSTHDLLELVELADAHHVPVRLVADHVDTSTATGVMLLTILAAVDQMTADLASEHAKDAVAARRARGDRVGGIKYGDVPGEDLGAVVTAFRDAGSYNGASKLLTARGIPTRLGRPWLAATVRAILLDQAPEVVPPRQHRGASAAPPFRLARLLPCPFDGKPLTGSISSEGTPRYNCVLAYSVPGHGPRYVSERKLLPWVQDEVARLRTPERVELVQGHERKRAGLNARRARIVDAYEAGTINREDYMARLAVVDADLEALDTERRILTIPAVDWSWEPGTTNRVLRSMFDHITLDEQLRPVSAEWLVPGWRAP